MEIGQFGQADAGRGSTAAGAVRTGTVPALPTAQYRFSKAFPIRAVPGRDQRSR
jgi:hypothetical protein